MYWHTYICIQKRPHALTERHPNAQTPAGRPGSATVECAAIPIKQTHPNPKPNATKQTKHTAYVLHACSINADSTTRRTSFMNEISRNTHTHT